MSEKVSVVITTKNRQKLLQRAVSSAIDQSYQNIEVIVVDDASKISSDRWCEEKGINYIYIKQEESSGGNYARNLGIKNSTGEYVAFLDDDDYWEPDKIDKQLKTIREKKAGVVYCGRRIEKITEMGADLSEVWLPNPQNQGDVHRRVLYEMICTSSTMMVKKELLFQAGLFDESLCFWQDYELCIRLAQITDFCFVNEPLCIYRVDRGDKQRLTNKYDGWKDTVKYINKIHCNLYEKQNLKERYLKQILYLKDAVFRTKSRDLMYLHYALSIIWWILSLPYRLSSIILKTLKLKKDVM